MASTPEMLRIIRHAAARLREENLDELAGLVDDALHHRRPRLHRNLRSLQVAITHAVVVLEMVAACMDDEPATTTGDDGGHGAARHPGPCGHDGSDRG